jgi:hypothetical protein
MAQLWKFFAMSAFPFSEEDCSQYGMKVETVNNYLRLRYKKSENEGAELQGSNDEDGVPVYGTSQKSASFALADSSRIKP